MFTITVYCGKGGTGKTTTATNLAAALAHYKKRVLLIDGDWQGSATISLGLNPSPKRLSIADLLLEQLKNPDKVQDYINYATEYLEKEKFYFIPANPLMNNKEFRYALSDPHHCYAFRDMLKSLNYDYIIIDTSPSLDVFLDLALNASNSVLIPTEMEYLAYGGLDNTMGIIATNIQSTNPNLSIVGILMNKIGKSGLSEHMKKATEQLAKKRGVHVFGTTIPLRENIKISPMKGQSVVNGRTSTAKTAYLNLAKELMRLIEKIE